jgi:uncharacterized protein (TIGR00297 family)
MNQFLLGLFAGGLISYLAYRVHALSGGGAIAAGILGTIVFGLGGGAWALVLLTFFITASALSKLLKSRKAGLNADFAKGSRRDAGQVAANGAVAGILALAFFFLSKALPESRWLPVLWIGFAASLAGANADTWATELGVLNPQRPVLLTTFKRVPQGTSGGVSLAGSLAALAGSALVAGVAVLTTLAGWTPSGGLALTWQFVIIALGGWVGSFVDSLLGATLQAIYYCPVCDKETERHPEHVCGTGTTLKRGQSWMNNDWVNAACTLSAALVGVVLAVIIF